ncbi:MAG: hypothetical protein AB4426_19665 [Xenococcaceae cyanobacterium]
MGDSPIASNTCINVSVRMPEDFAANLDLYVSSDRSSLLLHYPDLLTVEAKQRITPHSKMEVFENGERVQKHEYYQGFQDLKASRYFNL